MQWLDVYLMNITWIKFTIDQEIIGELFTLEYYYIIHNSSTIEGRIEEITAALYNIKFTATSDIILASHGLLLGALTALVGGKFNTLYTFKFHILALVGIYLYYY
eukprot:467297_1